MLEPSFAKEAELTAAHGFLVYKIVVVNEYVKKYKGIVDPGNGQVLMKKEITWCDYEHEKMKYGEEKYGSSATVTTINMIKIKWRWWKTRNTK